MQSSGKSCIELIVGLGNPGPQYAAHRHNVGAWFVDILARSHDINLRVEPKLHGKIGRLSTPQQSCWLFIPTTYMNESGRAVRAVAEFYKIAASSILVAHDELDFTAGIVRLKQNGGHGGHNGLRDIITQLQSSDFLRLRLGIGHPGHRDKVHDYVLSQPSNSDCDLILKAIDEGLQVLPDLLQGNIEQAIQQLHSES